MDEVDPDGLMPMDGPGSSPSGLDTSVAMGVGNMESYGQDSYSSSGYWTRGEPNPEHPYNIYGQLSNSGGEVITQWVPDVGNSGGFMCLDPYPGRHPQPSFLDRVWDAFLNSAVPSKTDMRGFGGGSGGGREINKVPDLTGKSRAEVDGILKGKGFNHKGQTAGGYEKYYHPDGGEILIRPNGEVTRAWGKGNRVDQFGNEGRNHNTGEFVK